MTTCNESSVWNNTEQLLYTASTASSQTTTNVQIQTPPLKLRPYDGIEMNVLLECGPMPNVMAALPNIGGALCSTPQSWLTPNTGVPCNKAAKRQNPLKLVGVPQTTRPISDASGPKFTIMWGHLEEMLLLNKFFPIVNTWVSCEDIAQQSCAMVPRYQFLCPVFSVSSVQHVSDLHSKFALRPHRVWKYGRHPISDSWD